MISVAEFLVILACSLTMFLILGVATWILINRRKILGSDARRDALTKLEHEYAAGEIDSDEYQRRRDEILSESR